MKDTNWQWTQRLVVLVFILTGACNWVEANTTICDVNIKTAFRYPDLGWKVSGEDNGQNTSETEQDG